ncbi:MAG TPA: hypothetical protein VNL91_08435 [Thermoanaerobaculia bacterium]|nr:hypothetical protein [Thermoanaerobaculia bacterium]
MARGWESKSVESQIEEARQSTERRETPTREEIERRARRDELELSRRRIVRELSEATSPLRRAALEHALAHLDGELEKMGAGPERDPAHRSWDDPGLT